MTVRLEEPEILPIPIPGDVPGMRVGDACMPVALRALSLRFLPFHRAAVHALSVRIGARVSRVAEGPDRGRRGERMEDHPRSRRTEARREAKSLVPESLHRLMGGADAREG